LVRRLGRSAHPYLPLRRDEVRLGDGNHAEREWLELPAAAAVLALTDAQEMVLVREYRYALGRALWSLPGGRVGAAETPEAAGARELEEETGYRPGRMTDLGALSVSPWSTEVIHYFRADELSPGQRKDDPTEVIQVGLFPVGAAVRLLLEDRTLASNIAGLALAGLWTPR
jgi:ADP-ribose pyrophosphatase